MARFQMSDGKYPIDNCSDVKDAWNLRGSSDTHSKASVAAHVRKAAKALDCEGPWDNDAVQEQGTRDFEFTLMMGQEGIDRPQIVQELADGSAPWKERGAVRIKFPYLVGEAIARTPGIEEELYFPTRNIAKTVLAGKEQIRKGDQPLTVYARHSHAMTMDHLPIGGIVDFEDAGSRGWAIGEIEPTSIGKDVIILLEGKKLNAMSLRARAGSYHLEPKEVNGVLRLEVDLDKVDGIDFAPDGPAQDTYGIELLVAEARVGPVPAEVEPPAPVDKSPIKEEKHLDLTLEQLRSEHGPLVAEIEAPHRAKIADLEGTVAQQKLVIGTAQRDAAVAKLAAHFPNPSEAISVLAEYCKDETTAEGVAIKAQPILLRAIKEGLAKPVEQEAQLAPEDKVLSALFPQATTNGSGVTQEATPKPGDEKKDEDKKPVLNQEKMRDGMPSLPF